MEDAKRLVHEALKQFPAAIPWFIGIYDDWTIGHLKQNSATGRVELYSENFSNTNFQLICKFLSYNLNQEIFPEHLLEYANFNGEPGRLVVKQLVKAVVDFTRQKNDTSHTELDYIGKANIENTALPPANQSKVNGAKKVDSATTILPTTRVKILLRDEFKCVYCGQSSKQVELKVDFISNSIPNKANDLNNLQTLCLVCYEGKNL